MLIIKFIFKKYKLYIFIYIMINCIYIIILIIILFFLINIYEDFESCKIITCQSGYILKDNNCVLDVICSNGQYIKNGICTDYNITDVNNIIANTKICPNLNVNINNICTSYITEYNFTNCGVSGRLGPTIEQCNSKYTDDNIISMDKDRQGIQIWKVPKQGRYLITVAGAGLNLGSNQNCRGVIISSVFTLNINDKIKILVGQSGVLNNITDDIYKKRYSGSGGTFVVKFTNDNDYTKENNIPMIIAGGGGGIDQSTINKNILYDVTLASFNTSGKDNYEKSNGGINGESRIIDKNNIQDKYIIGVQLGTPGSFYKDGNNSSIEDFGNYYYGYSFLNGGNGALCDKDNFFSVGGFGGGSASTVYRNGSGGGYSGGCYGTPVVGSGGGSYSSEKINIIGYNNGMGYVNIKYLGQ